jgi:putative sterol carrier protein
MELNLKHQPLLNKLQDSLLVSDEIHLQGYFSMQIDSFEDIKDFFQAIISNKHLYSELHNWGKSVRLVLDEKEYLFDFSESPQSALLDPDENKAVNFTIKTNFSVLKEILQKKIDPVEAFASGYIEVDGSIMELMEFAEILIERLSA